MQIEVFTILPTLVKDFLQHSLLQKAQQSGTIRIAVHDIRAAASDPHRSVDDAPFGGGPGMVLMAEPVFAAVEAADPVRPLLLLDPAGKPFTQAKARQLADTEGFSLLCGRYEGIDERIREHLVDEELSLGDFVLNGGEVAAMAVIEAVCRLVPGVLGNPESAATIRLSAVCWITLTTPVLLNSGRCKCLRFCDRGITGKLLAGGKLLRWRARSVAVQI